MTDSEPKPKPDASDSVGKVDNQWQLLHHVMGLLGRTGVIAAGVVVALYFGLRLYSSELGDAQERLRKTFAEVASVADRQVASVKMMLDTQEAAAKAERDSNQKRVEAERAAAEAGTRRTEALAELTRVQEDLRTKQRELAATTESKQTIEQQQETSTEQLRGDAELLALAVLGNDESGKAKEIAVTYAKLTAEHVQRQIEAFTKSPRDAASRLSRLIGAEIATLEAGLGKSKDFAVWVRATMPLGDTNFTIARAENEHGFADVIELSCKEGKVVSVTTWQHVDAVAVPDPEDVSRRRLFFVKLPYSGSGIALEGMSAVDMKDWNLASMLEGAFGCRDVRREGAGAGSRPKVLTAAKFLAEHQKEFESSFAGNSFDFAAGVRMGDRARSWKLSPLPRFVDERVRAAVQATLEQSVALATLGDESRPSSEQRELGVLGAAALSDGFRVVTVQAPTSAANSPVQQGPDRSGSNWELEIEWLAPGTDRRQRMTLLLSDDPQPRFAGIAEFGLRSRR